MGQLRIWLVIIVACGMLSSLSCAGQHTEKVYLTPTSVWTLTLKEFKDRVAQKNPTITGGCVTLTNAALASDLLMMALDVSAAHAIDGRAKSIDSLMHQVILLRDTLAMLADTDNYIFQNFKAAYRLPHNSVEESAQRDTIIHNLLVRATNSPLLAAETICNLFNMIPRVKELAAQNVQSDVSAACLMSDAAFKSLLSLAMDNVEQMNLSERAPFEKEINALNAKQRNAFKAISN